NGGGLAPGWHRPHAGEGAGRSGRMQADPRGATCPHPWPRGQETPAVGCARSLGAAGRSGEGGQVHADDLDGLGRLTDETVHWMDQRLARLDDDVTDQMQAVLTERLYVAPEDGLTLGSAVLRLSVFYELKKTGVLTYEEFRG